MQANEPNIKWIAEPKLGLTGKMYLPLVAQGLLGVDPRINGWISPIAAGRLVW